jgi:hypothetical protein
MAISMHSLVLRSSASTNVSLFNACWRAVFIPYSELSPGTITDGRGMINVYPPPAYWDQIAQWQQMPRYMESDGVIVAWSGLFLIGCSLAFIALPISRRRAKVLWIHVWRVMAYSVLLLFIPLMTMATGRMADRWRSQWGGWIHEIVREFLGPVLVFVALLFWQAAIKRYLKMEHSKTIAIAIIIMALGASVGVIFYAQNPMMPGEMWEWTMRGFE